LKITDSNLNPMFWTLHPRQQSWHHIHMPKRIKHEKRPTDVNELAHYLADESARGGSDTPLPSKAQISVLMAELGRKGGKIGGKRRMETMTPKQRRNVARKAAQARWKNK
jgi:hypothetical protein